MIRTRADGDMGPWLQWVLKLHAGGTIAITARRATCGQGRFKAFPIQEDEHLISVLRYVERNSLRAELVARARGLEMVKPRRLAS